jgi:hypothetical protein
MTYRELLLSLRRRALPILLVSFLCGAAFFSVTAFLLPERYVASTVFCVRNRTGYEEGITSADLAACESLTDPCIALMTGSEIMSLASGSLDGMTESALKSRLSFENMGAGVFRMSVTDGDAERARAAALAIAEASVPRIPAVIDAGALTVIDGVSVTPLARPAGRNAVIGFAAGLAVSVCFVIFSAARGKKARAARSV